MTPSVILLYVCSAVFVLLISVFGIFLIKVAKAAKSKKAPAGLSKQLYPAEKTALNSRQNQLRYGKAR